MDTSKASVRAYRERAIRTLIVWGAGAGLIILSAAMLFRAGGSTEAHVITPDPGSPVVGIDMVSDGSNTGTSLGAIDACFHVDNVPGAEFTIDTWLDAIPSDLNLDGYNYLFNFPSTATQMVGQDHSLMIVGGADLSQDATAETPDTTSPHFVTVANLGGTTTPGGIRGVLGRYTMEVAPDATSGLYTFSFDPSPGVFNFADISGSDWWYGPDGSGGGDDRGADIWDSNHVPQYGLLALGVPCGGTTTPAPTHTPTPTLAVTPTPAPTGTGQSPSPTATGETPTATPTPTSTGITLKQGDADCDGTANSVDALKLLRYVAQLSVAQEPGCPKIGDQVASSFGDVDCSSGVNSVDALKVLRFVAQLSVSQNDPCPLIGDPLGG